MELQGSTPLTEIQVHVSDGRPTCVDSDYFNEHVWSQFYDTCYVFVYTFKHHGNSLKCVYMGTFITLAIKPYPTLNCSSLTCTLSNLCKSGHPFW